MSAEQSIATYSNAALRGAIDSLAISGMWPGRRKQLERELARRKKKNTNCGNFPCHTGKNPV